MINGVFVMNSNLVQPRPYVPLRVRSNFSLLTGTAPVQRLVRKAAQWHLPALALTDENNLYGAIPFWKACRDAGIHPVLGTLLQGGGSEAVVLAENAAGYANLCHLISRQRLDCDFHLAPSLTEHQAGLVILTPDVDLAAALRRHLDTDRLWLELLRPAASQRQERCLLAAAADLGLGLVASSDLYMAAADELEQLAMLAAIRQNRLYAEMQPAAAVRRYSYLRPPVQFAALFPDHPEAVDATCRIAARCTFDLSAREPVFPRFGGNVRQQLAQQARHGAERRYGNISPTVNDRLRHELDLINRLGFADYFLVVADIVAHARSLGTPIAGRGSGASSLVAYSLGLTNVDPIHFNLPFERFLNEGRQDFPDLDIDICWRLRDQVIDYVYQKYGDDHVAMIATYATLQPRYGFRVTAKALGLSTDVITETLNRLPHIKQERLPAGEDAPCPASWRRLPADPRIVREALRFARLLEGFPHHLSVHPGGVVITPGPISREAPLQRATKGIVITQYDKDAAEDVGLIKLDLLGNRALSSVAEATRLVRQQHEIVIDPEQFPPQDEQTASLLAVADTVGVNQLESPAMRHLLRQLRPTTARNLMQALGLIRPGAASLGMKQAFVRRSRGVEAIPPIDPRLDGILRETHDIMLYEDEALLIAGALAGLPPDQADRFRKAVTKCRSDDERLQLSQRFLALCHRNDVDPSIAADLWVQMAKFNAYSFCRAHAASYGQLAWTNAYMKAHYPLQFWVGALNNNEGMYDKWVYIEEAKRGGIRILPPCVNRSPDEFGIDGDGIRIGLNQVRAVRHPTRQSILENRPFHSLFDFVARSAAGQSETENLIRAGALDFLERSRPQLLFDLLMCYGTAAKCRAREVLFAFPESTPTKLQLKDHPPAIKQQDEWRLLAMSAGPHPLAPLRPFLSEHGFATSRIIASLPDAPIRLCGLPAASRAVKSKTGGRMGFMTLSDEDGLFEIMLLPEVYAACEEELAAGGTKVLWVEGTAESQYDALSVNVNRIAPFRREDIKQLKPTCSRHTTPPVPMKPRLNAAPHRDLDHTQGAAP